MQTHIQSPIRDIPNGGSGTNAYWTLKPGNSGKAIIFVHGFKGEALSTWRCFNDLLPSHTECKDHDLIFYGHDGGRFHVTESAQYLHTFLNTLCTTPQTIFGNSFSPSMQRPQAFRYDKIMLVAHSLGAVLCRLALLTAHGRADAWAAKTRLVLFAPAHNGSDMPSLLSSALTAFEIPLVKILPDAVLKLRYKGAGDIASGSPLLSEMKQKTDDAIKAGGADYLKAVKVVWAQNDHVVVNGPFAQDEAAQSFPLSHVKVCKPVINYLDPITTVLQAI
jgi:pimeloyl-ACP methyl ester carboxylesterase